MQRGWDQSRAQGVAFGNGHLLLKPEHTQTIPGNSRNEIAEFYPRLLHATCAISVAGLLES